MTAYEIAETYVNGNISVARNALKRASKIKMLNVIEMLAVHYGWQSAVDIVRGLLA